MKLAEELKALEVRVMTAAGVGRSQDIAEFMADDFLEIGASGHKYSKSDVLGALPSLPRRKFSLTDFQVRELAPDIVLVNYRSQAVAKDSIAWAHRTTIWARRGGKWQIVFHQATPTKE